MDIKFKVPANLDIEQLAQTYSHIELPTKNKSTQILYAFCGTLLALQMRQGGYNAENDGHTNLCTIYFRSIHFQYKKFIDYLLRAGVLKTDGIHIEGEKCTGYKFTEKYMGQRTKEIVITEFLLRKRLKKQKAKIIKIHQRQLGKYRHITDWYLTHRLKIDEKGAREWIEIYRTRELLTIRFKSATKALMHEREAILIDKCNSMLHFVNRIESCAYDITEFTVDQTGHRLHGLFTYTKSELRNFITYDGAALTNIDWSNSQPYFSTILFCKEFWQSQKVKTEKLQLRQIAPDLYRQMREDKSIYNCITLLDSSKSLVQQRVSVGRYVNLVLGGRMYEKLQEVLPAMLSDSFLNTASHKISGRKKLKKEVLRALYFDSNDEIINTRAYNELYRAFKRLFPDVVSLFEAVKKNDYRRLAWILQRIESHLILRVICKEISKVAPNLPIFTIHDSIVTTAGNEELVEGVIKNVLEKKLGAAPALKKEQWLSENAYLSFDEQDYDITRKKNINGRKRVRRRWKNRINKI